MNTNEWQPIETAPKEHEKDIIICYYWKDKPQKQIVGCTFWCEIVKKWNVIRYVKITHWMPLPERPNKMKTKEWQLINTAPKDGTVIVGWNEEFGCETCNYENEIVFGWIVKSYFSNGDTYEFRPTHWMPLPEPPKTK